MMLIRFADASTCLACITVSLLNIPESELIMESSSMVMDALGKCLNSERLTSVKLTLAKRVLLISFFTIDVIYFLKKRGIMKAKTISTNNRMPLIFMVFFRILISV